MVREWARGLPAWTWSRPPHIGRRQSRRQRAPGARSCRARPSGSAGRCGARIHQSPWWARAVAAWAWARACEWAAPCRPSQGALSQRVGPECSRAGPCSRPAAGAVSSISCDTDDLEHPAEVLGVRNVDDVGLPRPQSAVRADVVVQRAVVRKPLALEGGDSDMEPVVGPPNIEGRAVVPCQRERVA